MNSLGAVTRVAIMWLLSFSCELLASQPDSTYYGTFTLGEIEVTGGEMQQTILPSHRLIEPAQTITGKQSVADALMRIPGVHFNYVGERNEARVFVRGFDTKRVPVFLDGIPVYVPYHGQPDLGRFLTHDISAISVSKGFSSALYGPNTLGGAINIVTRRPYHSNEGNAGISYGSGNARHLFFNTGVRREVWYFQAGGIYAASDYFPTSRRDTRTRGSGRENSYENDHKVSVKVAVTPNDTDEYAIGYALQRGKKGNPVYLGSHPSVPVRYWRWPAWDKESIYIATATRVLGYHTLRTRIYYDTFTNALYSYDDDTYSTMVTRRAFRSYHEDYTYGATLDLSLEPKTLVIIRTALHYKRDVHRERQNDGPRLQHDDQFLSAAVEIQIPMSRRMIFIGGVSIDHLQAMGAAYLDELADDGINFFPTHNTTSINPQAGVVFNINGTRKLHATIARKSRLPTMRDRYSFRLGRTIPNPSISEERATHYEIGYSTLVLGNMYIKSELFFSSVNDFIMFVTVPDPVRPNLLVEQNVNIGYINKYGMDIHSLVQLHRRLDCDLSYSYIRIDNHTTDDKTVDIPRHTFHGSMSWQVLGTAQIRTDITAYSKRYSSSDGERIADGFVVTNLTLDVPLFHAVRIRSTIRNLFDTAFEYIEGFPQPGRSFTVGVHASW